MAGVTLNAVKKRFGAVEVIHGVDLTVDDGEFVVFVGPSGCGKSTLLRMIAGLEDISDGEVSIGGTMVNDIEPADRGIAMVFQSYALYPHMSVEQNLSFGLRMNGRPKDDIARRVSNAAAILQIEPLLARRPKQLSGGQRQRVAIGRAIVRQPEVFLFDEPLSNLDAELRVQMRVEIARLHKELGTTMIYVTHDQTEAMTLADKIVVLRDGRVEQVGAPLDLYDDPANRFVAGFVGSPRMNFMAARVIDAGPGSVTVEIEKHGSPRLSLPVNQSLNAGDAVTVGIRPEHFGGSAGEGASLTVDVDVAEHLGATSFVYANMKTGEQLIIEREQSRSEMGRTELTVTIPPGRAYLFDSQGDRIR
ncbi:ABC transporter ATP-binding protein [Pelagibacterium halotolerans]|uniref:Maltose/maltodextrin transport ATP-binding protein MalK n=1 Tax=Pelagibacterium halotolerans (strain DSM 22347 / JCM 15775 / CGMCC 1.7692 / B2) TaxID=1082931 RepID=G4RFX7_PELHB|nr:sn-glycerol-3-phosphate ABC transporter ATP-binding protein UgpC [Pelagibacterium halotolerans]AEQ51020.1 maltose/maltodextrin transport ATP-binding protein MalK [Pelagibacterium halotolerans B2]QJR19090.1 sn-glycerol-3-phosphate ABC transporter ATP-binding protein UgpC [Pelagibacterium halotolerans]SEA02690.1 carbohydrate ABC transporter ATP-binding protein, CUT1 family [Pelagibacterium halotolerans]